MIVDRVATFKLVLSFCKSRTMKGVSKYSCIEAMTYQEDLKHISSSFIFWKKSTFDQISYGQHSFHQ
jgi:hypothetical protein